MISENAKPKNRIEYIDLARGFAIVFVLIGHISIISDSPFSAGYSIPQIIVYSFHIPLFFFISGMCFSDKQEKFFSFLLKKIKTIILPYLVFSAIWYVYEIATAVFIYHKSPTFQFLTTKAANYFLQIRYLPLWFLTCLFVLEIMFYALRSVTKNNKVLLVVLSLFILGIGVLYKYFVGKDLVWNIDLAFLMFIFMTAGYLFKTVNIRAIKKSVCMTLFIVLFLLGQVINFLNVKYYEPHFVDIMFNAYGNMILFYLSAFSGILSIVFLSVFLENRFDGIKYLGQNTLLIYALHQILFRICETLLLRFNLSNWQLYIIWAVIICFTILLFMLITRFVNATPLCVLIGKKYERKSNA